jgi:hypothetical protein
MLWYKAWLETRWRFLIGLVLLMLSLCASVLTYPQVVRLLSQAPPVVDASGEMNRRVAEVLALSRSYRGYVWAHWYQQNLLQMWTVFAMLLGTGGLLAQASGGGALFTLSLPATRARLLGVRAATGLAELLFLAIVPSLLLPVLSPAVGGAFAVGDVFVYGVCLFVAGTVFFSLAFLMSTVFSDVWRPLLVAFCAAAAISLAGLFLPALAPYSLFRVMAGESYFRGHGVPWLGLLASAAASAAMLYGAAINLARRDF